ncbi:MAG: glycerol-3-phosphate 1-O-acyltransferase PlsY [Candidatus Omnitrophica bacterium]|jgi:glycerol-3-phosphate acyltransferase PlsY|nr:glycerol-3-phosphate 1-O-acyltransferase PlsY [Candidatus Omnitrophota bacterium]MDD3987494.1 glycerol-3-phosphate 1-O-acyltransferase PlsY [Candidatus Omnitrophota bacterium]MDD4982066.1 glycerol-3-phosphate 1-O-acyltransferase PlsY [Candidatus Omnitrophota bacterium]MDD5665192.1 glycerol-3-phosphate 1-O-acyltransferase PlsY [Candidatus Omnitrophota bacterium]
MPAIILAVILSYLIGSIPTAYIFVRLIKKADIRKIGSGNVGATNALRVLGKGWGITVLILDIFKGFFPVIVLGSLFVPSLSLVQECNLSIIIGLSAICGHNWTIFLNFKGGKGVATTLGVLIGLAFRIPGLNVVLGLTVLVWIVSFVLIRIISISSILAALSFPIFTLIYRQSNLVILAGILLSLFVILRHKSNIKRLLKGEEPRLSLKK